MYYIRGKRRDQGFFFFEKTGYEDNKGKRLMNATCDVVQLTIYTKVNPIVDLGRQIKNFKFKSKLNVILNQSIVLKKLLH